MAFTLTKNLKLRIDSNLTANAKYNLERIDLLGGSLLVDSTDALNFRSRTDINLEPNSPDVDGSGVGGSLNIGNSSHSLEEINLFSDSVNLSSALGLLDQAAMGNTYLRLKYASDSSSSLDTLDRSLTFDVQGADRQLILGGDLEVSGTGKVTFNLTGDTVVTFPSSGTVITDTTAATLSNKTINADQNTILNIRNANVASDAAIAYSKLVLTASIVGSDISPSAAIPYSSLSLAGSILDSDVAALAAIAYSKLALTGQIRDSDLSASASISYSKLALSNSILNGDISGSAAISYSKLNLSSAILNSDISASAGISYSKLSLTGQLIGADLSPSAAVPYSKLQLTGQLLNSDVSNSAAIAGTKINPDFGTQDVQTQGNLKLSNGSFLTSFQASVSQAANITYSTPATAPTGNQVLRANNSDPTKLEWATSSGSGTVTSVDLSVPSILSVSGNPITSSGTIAISLSDQAANIVFAGPNTGSAANPTFRSLVPTDIPQLDHGGLAGLGDDDHTQYHTDARALTWLGTRSTSDLIEGTNKYYTDERVDDRVAALLQQGTGISLVYDDTGNTLTIATTITQYTNEMAQDAVGGILTDSSSIDFTYDDAGNSITAVVLPAGVNHNALQNYSANEHVDHTSVQIATAATSGLTGGGTIAATRNIVVDPTQATTASIANGDIVLFADISASNALRKTTVSDLLSLGGGSFATDWTSGTTKTVSHSLGSRDVLVQLYDNTTFETIYVNSVIRTDANTVDLTSSLAPAGSGWRVLVKKL